jgi:hypothetical protein
MATKKPAKAVARKTTGGLRPLPPVKPKPCSKTFEFFKDVTIGPGAAHDSGTPVDIDCYQWIHAWVLAKHPANMAMENITVELVFELPGKVGATGLANLEFPLAAPFRPTPVQARSGMPAGGFGSFVIRAPVIGPGVRAIVINNGAQTYDFTVWGYATH